MSEDENLSQLQSDDAYLTRFLNCTEFVVEEAYKKIKMFYEFLIEYPEWFTTGCPLEKKDIIDQDIRIITGECDKEGRPLYIVKIGNMNTSTMDIVKDVVPVDDFYVETLLSDTSSYCSKNGLCVLIDISNFSIKLMKWLTPSNIRNAIRRIETMPIKEYKYHVINSSFLIHTAIKVIWPFLPQHFKESISFHFNDWNSLYQHIDQEILPVEYGGQKDLSYNRYHLKVYDSNSDIAKSFEITRKLYLKNIETNKEIQSCF